MMIVRKISQVDGSVQATILVPPGDEQLYQGVPGYAAEAPPECAAGLAPAYINGLWSCVEDMRGTQWHDPSTRQRITITALGQRPPASWVEGAPPPDGQGLTIEL